MGSIPIGSTNYDGPLSLGYLVTRETASGFEPRPSRQKAGFPARLLSVNSMGGPMMRVIASAISGRSLVVEHPVPTREVAGSIPVSNDLVRSLSTDNAETRCRARLQA